MGRKSRNKKLKKKDREKFSDKEISNSKNSSHNLLNLFKKIKINRITFICLFSFFLFGFLYFYLTKSDASVIGGELTNLGDIELSYNSHQNEGISPLCGCFLEQNEKTWRGISFTARNIQLKNTNNRTQLTGYFITSPFPKEIDWLPFIKFNARIFLVALPFGEKFNPMILLDEKIINNNNNIRIKNFPSEKAMYFFAEESVNISLLGDYPVGCWIPVRNSNVLIKNYKGMFPNSILVTNIEETYEEYYGKVKETDSETLLTEYLNYPLGDFLGPNIVLWCDTAAVIMKTMETLTPKPIYMDENFIENNKDKQIITALLINPPFSARISCLCRWS